MKLTTAETRAYGDLRVKVAAGQASAADMQRYEALVVKMAKPEPRPKKRQAKAAATPKAKKS